MKSMTEEYDFIVIGAGGVGLAAAMYGARLGLKTLVLGHSYNSGLPIGGTITMTNVVENYPGFKKTSGLYLSKKIKEHAESYDLVTIKQEEALEVEKKAEEFYVKTKKSDYLGKTILFATGTKIKKLDIPGSEEFENKGIGYCSLCDAPLYKDKVVGVVGGSDSASIDALILSEYAKKVYIIYRKEKIHPEEATLNKILKNKKIEIINNTKVIEVKGTKKFLSDLAKKLGVNVNLKEEIIIDHKTSKTNIKGVFAAGDVTDKHFKQLITGVADGCTAAYSAFEYIN